MEGSVNMQTEGHIGVVCFGKFNASIEARRLPSSWSWVSVDEFEDDTAGVLDEASSLVTADEQHGVIRQFHSTGHWTDEQGQKVSGRLRFRIRNFDVGLSGDTSFLSLEGTMLSRDGERKLVAEEARQVQLRRDKKSGGGGGGKRTGKEKRRVPDFAKTMFHIDEEVRETEQAPAEKDKILMNPDDDPPIGV